MSSQNMLSWKNKPNYPIFVMKDALYLFYNFAHFVDFFCHYYIVLLGLHACISLFRLILLFVYNLYSCLYKNS